MSEFDILRPKQKQWKQQKTSHLSDYLVRMVQSQTAVRLLINNIHCGRLD